METNNSPLFIPEAYEEGLNQYRIEEIENKMEILQRNWIRNMDILKNKTESELKSHFFEDIFIKILSYEPITSGGDSWNINIESSTEVDSQRADAILGYYTKDKVSNRTLTVIEIKGPEVDLDVPQNRSKKNYGTPVEQAYNYSFKHDGCKWIIVSNIYEIRLYQVGRSTVYYEAFLLEELAVNKNLFRKFHFLLCKANLLGAKTNELSEKAYKKLEKITSKFYQLYSNTRIELWNALIEENPSYDHLLLLEKAQKILDRVIFICFCQSRGLLKTTILNEYIDGAEKIEKVNIWNYLKGLFRSIDVGDKAQNINQFNGELFKHDPVLDYYLEIPDRVFKMIKLLANHDFNKNLNVNILGHIFEQSISDIEGLKKNDNTNKRKSDGIFYTPEYLTKYIVENTFLHWIDDKKHELGYNQLRNWKDTETISGRTRRINSNYEFWQKYSLVLDNIKIIDPACGSGAFLNQAFDYLIKEKEFINAQMRSFDVLKGIEPKEYEEIQATFQQPQFIDLNLDKNILNGNLFGVDRNRESVEISKLSLWLNTANPNKKLTNLNNNIKFGDSLIEDPEIARDTAFRWANEFKEVIETGGFDIIIGNPPYVLSRGNNFSRQEKDYFSKKYQMQQDKPNTYLLFIERALQLLKENGYLGFIVPNSWLGIDSATELRKYLLKNTVIKSIVNLYGISFPDANVETVIIILQKKSPKNNVVSVSNIMSKKIKLSHSSVIEIPQSNWLKNRNYIYDLISDEEDNLIINKIIKRSKKLQEVAEPKTGLQAYEKNKGNPKQSEDDVKNRIYDYTYKYDSTTYPYLNGGDVGRYSLGWGGDWLKYGEWLSQPRTIEIFSGGRILIREVVGSYPKSILATYVTEKYLNNKSILNILPKINGYNLKYILAVLNSNVISFYFKRKAVKANRTLFPKITKGDLDDLPIPIATENVQNELAELSMELINLNKKFKSILNTSHKIIIAEFNIKITKALINFHKLNSMEFIAEIKKQNKHFSLLEKGNELFEWFETQQKEIKNVEDKVNMVENEINKKIYDLFFFTPEEINLIEGYNLG
ncbi:Eco57I restriction-modification methylase domain-containing protein [Domibacillus mangrovi]|uniref:site-specific DNA-methyltransferase (adenine-specific) n=1 Tax=Domibacillus mangrovi TaxID=1714354 RepID=A0A1Q5P489_9BACI|nr:N-6 DNA methylase [Domibacillus mangrovi]OKL37028.1 hypothetical protein BLL40_05405 [Domibacillus mangrovi]